MRLRVPCLTVLTGAAEVPGGESSRGPGALDPGRARCRGVSCCGGGELADVEPTEPGSLKPCALFSSGLSKKLRLNSEPASKETSALILSGEGALPRLPLRDWSILKTSIVPSTRRAHRSHTHARFFFFPFARGYKAAALFSRRGRALATTSRRHAIFRSFLSPPASRPPFSCFVPLTNARSWDPRQVRRAKGARGGKSCPRYRHDRFNDPPPTPFFTSSSFAAAAAASPESISNGRWRCACVCAARAPNSHVGLPCPPPGRLCFSRTRGHLGVLCL